MINNKEGFPKPSFGKCIIVNFSFNCSEYNAGLNIKCFTDAIEGFKSRAALSALNSAEMSATNISKAAHNFLRQPFFFPIFLNDFTNDYRIQHRTPLLVIVYEKTKSAMNTYVVN